MKRIRSQRGDTIVEVLISIAIIGVILAGAYAASNRSLTDIRDAQEHEQAIALAESQLEILDSTPKSSIPPGNGSGSDFCFDPTTYALKTVPSVPCVADPSAENYQITISKHGTPIGGGLQTFEVDITWPSLNGNQDQVQLFYQPELSS